MRSGVLIPLFALLAASCAAEEHNVLTAAEKANGWVLLFDGKTMDHWRDPGQLDPPGDGWTIEDGALKPVSNARIVEDLVSSEEYRDFELEWEWRISLAGNTGLKFRIQAFPIMITGGAPPEARSFEAKVQFALQQKLFDRRMIPAGHHAEIYPLGFEYQLIDDNAHPDAKRGPLYQTGALYSITPPVTKASRPVGSYNHSRLVVRGDHFEHWLNGKKVLDVTVTAEMLRHALETRWGEDSLPLQMLMAQSKKSCPITLQNHGDAAWFRDIKIRKLNR
jgi:hypothetical protein